MLRTALFTCLLFISAVLCTRAPCNAAYSISEIEKTNKLDKREVKKIVALFNTGEFIVENTETLQEDAAKQTKKAELPEQKPSGTGQLCWSCLRGGCQATACRPGLLTSQGEQQGRNLGLFIAQSYPKLLPSLGRSESLRLRVSKRERTLAMANAVISGIWMHPQRGVMAQQTSTAAALAASQATHSKAESSAAPTTSSPQSAASETPTGQNLYYENLEIVDSLEGARCSGLRHIIAPELAEIAHKLERPGAAWATPSCTANNNSTENERVQKLYAQIAAAVQRDAALRRIYFAPLAAELLAALEGREAVALLAGHTQALAAALLGLGIAQTGPPPFGTALIIELYTRGTNKYVAVRLNGRSVRFGESNRTEESATAFIKFLRGYASSVERVAELCTRARAHEDLGSPALIRQQIIDSTGKSNSSWIKNAFNHLSEAFAASKRPTDPRKMHAHLESHAAKPSPTTVRDENVSIIHRKDSKYAGLVGSHTAADNLKDSLESFLAAQSNKRSQAHRRRKRNKQPSSTSEFKVKRSSPRTRKRRRRSTSSSTSSDTSSCNEGKPAKCKCDPCRCNEAQDKPDCSCKGPPRDESPIGTACEREARRQRCSMKQLERSLETTSRGCQCGAQPPPVERTFAEQMGGLPCGSRKEESECTNGFHPFENSALPNPEVAIYTDYKPPCGC